MCDLCLISIKIIVQQRGLEHFCHSFSHYGSQFEPFYKFMLVMILNSYNDLKFQTFFLCDLNKPFSFLYGAFGNLIHSLLNFKAVLLDTGFWQSG